MHVLKSEVDRFIKFRLGLSVHTITLEISPIEHAKCKACFINCGKVNQRKFEKVSCWIIYNHTELTTDIKAMDMEIPEIPAGLNKHCFEAELHCIIRRKRDGRLYDITPDFNGHRTQRTIVFEPRINAERTTEFLIKHGSIENIASKYWDTVFPPPGNLPNFFEVVEQLN